MKTSSTIILFLLTFNSLLMAQGQQHNNQPSQISQNRNGVAINGYDPVAYFKEQKAVKGHQIYSCEWNDATWYFSSEQNRDLFLSNPKGYAPQYGGYCAHAITNNKLVISDPQSFAIKNDKLYLFRDKKSKQKALFNFTKTHKKRADNWLNLSISF